MPALIDRLPTLRPELRRRLAFSLLRRGREGGGVLAWNASRSRADELLDRFAR